MIEIQLQPVDTWFFRDGTPFTMGKAPQENVISVFPPHPPTVAGALRAALARGKGWNGRGRWTKDICDVLGDGPEDLGALSLYGPFLLREGLPLFRVPRHVLGSAAGAFWKPSTFLRPGGSVACDLGEEIRLPEVVGSPLDVGSLKPGDRCWLTREGLNAVLHGHLPCRDSLIPDSSLWSDEPRIGLQRDSGTRTASEGMLYSTRHVRPCRDTSLGVRVTGLPRGWVPPFGQLVTLGGEGQLAECREWKADVALSVPMAEIEATGKVVVVALSPLDLPKNTYLGRESLDVLGNARVVSACVARPQRIGGWDSLARRPLPLRSVLPPGSALFCEIADLKRFAGAVAAGDGLARIGSRQEWGFGLVALGVWPDSKEDN